MLRITFIDQSTNGDYLVGTIIPREGRLVIASNKIEFIQLFSDQTLFVALADKVTQRIIRLYPFHSVVSVEEI